MRSRRRQDMPPHLRLLVDEQLAREARQASDEGGHAPRPQAREPGPKLTKLERRYRDHLEAEQAAGRVLAFRFEAVKLCLSVGKRFHYTADFVVLWADGRLELVECKPLDRRNGRALFVREDSRIKVKAAAELFRWTEWTFVVVWPMPDGTWGREVL